MQILVISISVRVIKLSWRHSTQIWYLIWLPHMGFQEKQLVMTNSKFLLNLFNADFKMSIFGYKSAMNEYKISRKSLKELNDNTDKKLVDF